MSTEPFAVPVLRPSMDVLEVGQVWVDGLTRQRVMIQGRDVGAVILTMEWGVDAASLPVAAFQSRFRRLQPMPCPCKGGPFLRRGRSSGGDFQPVDICGDDCNGGPVVTTWIECSGCGQHYLRCDRSGYEAAMIAVEPAFAARAVGDVWIDRAAVARVAADIVPLKSSGGVGLGGVRLDELVDP